MVQYVKAFICFLLLLSVTAVKANTIWEQDDNTDIDSLKAVYLNTTSDSIKIIVLCNMSIHLRSYDNVKAMQYADSAVRYADSIRFIYGQIRAYTAFAGAFFKKADYKNALFYYLRALRFAEMTDDSNAIAKSFLNIGTVYSHLNNYTMAKRYLFASLAVEESIKQDYGLSVGSIYNNLGTIDYERGNLEESINYFKAAAEAALKYSNKKLGSTVLLAYSLLNLGEGYSRLGKLDSAEYYFKKVLGGKPTDYELVGVYNGLGKVYGKRGDFANAEKYFLDALAMVQTVGGKELEQNIYNNLAMVYRKNNKPDLALTYYMKYNALKDSLNDKTIVRQLKEMMENYEISKRDNEILLLNKDNAISKAAINKERILRNSFIGALAFVFMILFMFIRNNIHKQKANKILRQQKEQIELQKIEIETKNKILSRFNELLSAQNKELTTENIAAKYEVLRSKVNPHFLFNSLSTLSSIVTEDSQLAIEYIEHFSDLYRMILETSEVKLLSLEQELKIVHHYLYLQKMEFEDNLLISVDIPDEQKQLLLPPFAIQMVVENAIKHNIITTKDKLCISIYTKDNYIVIENNLQRKNTKPASTGTGQKSIIERYKLLTEDTPLLVETSASYIVSLPLLKEQKELINVEM